MQQNQKGSHHHAGNTRATVECVWELMANHSIRKLYGLTQSKNSVHSHKLLALRAKSLPSI